MAIDIYFYSDEYKPIGSKPLEKLHLHFIGQEGEIRVYLSEEKYLDIDEKWGEIPSEEQTEIKKFVKKNYQDIMFRVEFYLEELRLKLKQHGKSKRNKRGKPRSHYS